MQADARTVLKAVFSSAEPGYQVEVRAVPGTSDLLDPRDPDVPKDLSSNSEWYFSVCLRGQRGTIEGATLAWCDVDKPGPKFDPDHIVPKPTVVVSSGKGYHMYWALVKQVEPIVAVRLTKLATLAFNGDVKVCEPKRVMRVPGSMNLKYVPPRPCEVLQLRENVTYEAAELEEYLVAECLVRHWDGGNRHSLALGLGAVLGRAGWDQQRVESTVKHVCSRTGDNELRDRLTAAVGTLARRDAGMAVSVGELRTALGDGYKRLIDALGITARDGDILMDGMRVGSTTTMERDLVDLIAGMGDWAFGDGTILRWTGQYWAQASDVEFAAWIFQVLAKLFYVSNGEEVEFNATAKLSRAIAGMTTGRLAAVPLDDPALDYLPVSNGVLHLTDGALLDHERAYRNRWVLPIEYKPGMDCPAWERFIAEAAPAEVDFLQEWLGYCLLATNPWQRMMWVYGPSGTGKSKFLEVLTALFGPSCVAVSSERMNEYAVASLSGARVALCSELSNRTLRTSLLKALAASDIVVGRHPYGRPFNVTFSGKIVWASNTLPPVDQGEGVWRRLIVVPFVNKPREEDVFLGDKLRAELPGILNWAMDGLARVRTFNDDGAWPLPESVLTTVSEYREAADPFKQFVADELELMAEGLVPAAEYVVPAKELYQRYSMWARERGLQPEPFGPIFWREMKKFGLQPADKPQRVNGRLMRVWSGARLLPEVFS